MRALYPQTLSDIPQCSTTFYTNSIEYKSLRCSPFSLHCHSSALLSTKSFKTKLITMSLIRFFYDPQYTVEDFTQLVDDAFDARFAGGRGNRNGESKGVVKPFSPRYVTSSSLTLTMILTKAALRMDLHEDVEANQVTATFELPGLKKEDVTIDVHNDHLVISGETNTSSEEKKDNYSVRERRFGKFSRTLPLPKGTKPESINAKMENGVLLLTFPKTHPDQAPTRIAIA